MGGGERMKLSNSEIALPVFSISKGG